jgi:hypothetical protein
MPRNSLASAARLITQFWIAGSAFDTNIVNAMSSARVSPSQTISALGVEVRCEVGKEQRAKSMQVELWIPGSRPLEMMSRSQ